MQRRVVCITAMLLCVMNAYTDGIYIPNYQAKPPTIPSQRAIIVFKDGVERLQVESVVQSEGTSLAWILPVPATPTDIHEASPGFLKTLFLNIKPIIRGDEGLGKGYVTAKLVAAVIALWCLGMLISGRGFRAALFPLILGAIPCVIFTNYENKEFPVAAGAPAPETPTHVILTSIVGNYDVSVLEAPDGAALDTWLRQNGFAALQPKGQAIVNDYIKEGWRFVAAKLRTEAGQLLSPHPLDISFPTKQPVYPMRLTALAGSDVYVELFVVADKAAANNLLATQLVGRLQKLDEKSRRYRPNGFAIDTGLRGPWSLAHPDTLKYLYMGCILTRLEGTFRPRDMDKDVVLGLAAPEQMRGTLYTLKARNKMVWTSVLLFWSFALAPMVLLATLRKAAKRRRAGIVAALCAATLLSTGQGSYRWKTIPATDATKVLNRYAMEPTPRLVTSHRCLYQAHDYATRHPGFNDMLPAEQASFFHAFLTYVPTYNELLGDAVRLEDSPKNVNVEVCYGHVVATQYDNDGYPTFYTLDELEDLYHKRSKLSFPTEGGDPKALESLIMILMNGSDYEYPRDPVNIDILVAVEQDPQRLSGPVIAVVEQVVNGVGMRPWVLDLAVGSLGLATKTVPPPDLSDRDALKAFLAQVKSQLQTQAATPNPGG